MNNINDIIKSELITKVNNVNVRKEQGIVGSDANIIIDSGATILKTDYDIEEILYVAVQKLSTDPHTWSTLVFGVDYIVDTELNRIKVLPVDGNDDQVPVPVGDRIYVCYLRARGSFTSGILGATLTPPSIASFNLTPQQGGVNQISFNFNILPQDGVNISWSILRVGGATPLYQGTALSTVNGQVPDGSGGFISLDYDVLTTDQLNYSDTGLPFTLVVTYELLTEPVHVADTILADTVYIFDAVIGLTFSLNVQPDVITEVSPPATSVEAALLINNPSGIAYSWILRRDKLAGVATVPGDFIDVAAGTTSGAISNTFQEDLDILAIQPNINYWLLVKEEGEAFFTTKATDVVTIAIAGDITLAKVGYVDLADARYEVSPGVWEAVSTEPEYTNRVPGASGQPAVPTEDNVFTRTVDTGYLSNDTYLNAPVNSGITNKVYFVIEVPNTWGEVEFYQNLGTVSMDFFNKIPLNNGYTAYLYAAGSSSHLSPVDFKIRPKT